MSDDTTYANRHVAGFPVRKPFPGEMEFFRKYPNVAGMAAEDNAIVLNPFTKLSKKEQQSVAINEAVRLFMKKNKINLEFRIEPSQEKMFKDFEARGIPGERTDADIRATLIGRIISGDPSAKNVTDEQKKAAEIIAHRMGLR